MIRVITEETALELQDSVNNFVKQHECSIIVEVFNSINNDSFTAVIDYKECEPRQHFCLSCELNRNHK